MPLIRPLMSGSVPAVGATTPERSTGAPPAEAHPGKPRHPDSLAWDAAWDVVDEWGAQSFPASDPPANW